MQIYIHIYIMNIMNGRDGSPVELGLNSHTAQLYSDLDSARDMQDSDSTWTHSHRTWTRLCEIQ